jgi:hypothetical protein
VITTGLSLEGLRQMMLIVSRVEAEKHFRRALGSFEMAFKEKRKLKQHNGDILT